MQKMKSGLKKYSVRKKMATRERNDIVYILTTENKNILRVGYINHRTNERFPQITSAEPFKYCYFRFVYDGKKIYQRLIDRLGMFDDDDEVDVLEDDGCLKVNGVDCNDFKYMLDLEVKGQNGEMSPPSYKSSCRGRR